MSYHENIHWQTALNKITEIYIIFVSLDFVVSYAKQTTESN